TGREIRPFPNPKGIPRFGHAVAENGSSILVGAPDTGSAPGAAYAFDEATGALAGSFTIRSAAQGPGFGTAVAWLRAKALVGAPSTTKQPGAAYLFDPPQSSPTVFTDPSAPPGLGRAVAVVDTTDVLVADPDAGLVFRFDGSARLLARLTPPSPTPGFGTSL